MTIYYKDFEISIYLTPIQWFYRPAWAYQFLPNGPTYLRKLLFGQTDSLMADLRELGQVPLTNHELQSLINRYQIHPQISNLLQAASQDTTALSLAHEYQSWEDSIFDDYYHSACRNEWPHPFPFRIRNELH